MDHVEDPSKRMLPDALLCCVIDRVMRPVKISCACRRAQYLPLGREARGKFEIVGSSDTVDRFISEIMPLGLVDVSRTGIVAIARGAEEM